MMLLVALQEGSHPCTYPPIYASMRQILPVHGDSKYSGASYALWAITAVLA